MTPTVPRATGVRLDGLVKTFKTSGSTVHAVRGVDLDIAAGETIALLGPNGAGKSTTIDILLGLTQPDAGTVSLFGLRPYEAAASGLIGAMLQTGGLLGGLTVGELIAMMAGLFPNPLNTDEVLRLANIGDLADRRTEKLSGGQTQRVRFAIALVSDPDLLVLDEPTVAMDVEARRDFWATMRRFATAGKTVVFATHYLEEADTYADRIILMARGKVVADGSAADIKARVGGRAIRATLPGADAAGLTALAGVRSVEVRGNSVVLSCADSDRAIRALLAEHPGVSDIEISGADLEEAFVQLTADTEAVR